jgi:hypothetical protein
MDCNPGGELNMPWSDKFPYHYYEEHPVWYDRPRWVPSWWRELDALAKRVAVLEQQAASMKQPDQPKEEPK